VTALRHAAVADVTALPVVAGVLVGLLAYQGDVVGRCPDGYGITPPATAHT
jgi:hypothetical protein